MEYLNRIEVTGVAGNVERERYNRANCVRFQVSTEFGFAAFGGGKAIETTWFDAVAWDDSPDRKDCEDLYNGSRVTVTGRIRMQVYTDREGYTHTRPEIVVQTLRVHPPDTQMETQIA